MAEYRIFSRNADLSREREITDFSKLEFVSRLNRAGSWKLDGDGDIPMTSQNGIFIERDGSIIFSGVVRKISKKMTAKEHIGRSWTITGIDDLGRLGDRIAHPDPTNLTISAAQYDSYTGAAETAILRYANLNALAGAHVSRRFALFQAAAGSGRGVALTVNARFQNLLDFLLAIAIRSGLGYRTRYDSGLGSLVFECFQPVDHSADVMFSTDFGNLQGFDYSLEAPKVNAVYVLGKGESTARGYAQVSDATSIGSWERIEAVKDQRSEPDAAKLAGWGNDEITENKEKEGYKITPMQMGEVGFVYGVDYGLGDLVSVADEGVALAKAVTEVKVILNSSGEEISPSMGDVKDIPLKATFERLEDLESRVGQLEVAI